MDRCITSSDVNRDSFVVKLSNEPGDLGSLGGMTGSETYTLAEGSEPKLIGFYYEAGEHSGTHVPLRITHADFLKADGTLDWGRVI